VTGSAQTCRKRGTPMLGVGRLGVEESIAGATPEPTAGAQSTHDSGRGGMEARSTSEPLVTTRARSQALGGNRFTAAEPPAKGRPSVAHVEATTQAQLSVNDPLLTPEELSALLGGIPTGTLKRWRSQRCGPVALHVGRHVRYRRSMVEAWLREKDLEAASWMAS
jgi:hypothetical protein